MLYRKLFLLLSKNPGLLNFVDFRNRNFLIPICMKPDGLNIQYFKFILWNKIHNLKYLRSLTLGCKDIGIRKSEILSQSFEINDIYN